MLIPLLLLALTGGRLDPEDWPQWRGPHANGSASETAAPPLRWSEEENVRWKVPLLGEGHSTPVVHGGQVFLTRTVPVGEPFAPLPDDAPGAHDNRLVSSSHRLQALAFDLATGKLLWERTLRELVPHEGGHETGTFASASPAVDDEHLYAFFGSHGLFCLDHDGLVLWEKDLGEQATKHGHGEGASPHLAEGKLVINWDHEGQSFLVCLDGATGEELWRQDREEVTSWATPVSAVVEGRTQVIVSGTGRLRAYDLESGEVIWSCGGLAHNVVASPVVGVGMAFAASSYEKQSMLAIRLAGASGDLTTDSEHLLWMRRRSVPYVPSPLFHGGWLYVLNHYQGIISRIEARTGAQPRRSRRLDGVRDVYASPIAAAGRIYVVDRSGVTVVLEHSEDFPELARNWLEDSFSASPVAVGDALLLRGERNLYCLAVPAREAR